MTTYSLQLQISPADLNHIRAAGMRIILGRTMQSGQPNVAWASFDPIAGNEVEWNDEFGIYASATSLQQGATIAVMAQTGVPARSGARYTFTPPLFFSGPAGGGAGPDSYTVQNDVPPNQFPLLAFGLTQSLLINQHALGDAPISATPVLAFQAVTLRPGTSVLVWLQSGIRAGTFTTRIPSNVATARFDGGVTRVALRYDATLGVFVPV
jgi:hypothetical protein